MYSQDKMSESEDFVSRFENDYEVKNYIGKGGFGVVFEAKHKLDNHTYAIKRITVRNLESRNEVRREVIALAELEHPNIVRYFYSWEESPPLGWYYEHNEQWIKERFADYSISTVSTDIGSTKSEKEVAEGWNSNVGPTYVYIQMQLCHKDNLREWLGSHLVRDFSVIQDIFSQIVEGVAYVHMQGFVHRDLKPSNIFFSLDGKIKVGDFGLIKNVKDVFDFGLTKNDNSAYHEHMAQAGTELYMSPEQLKNVECDYTADIYALGLIFFELLVPFATEMERIITLTNVKKGIYTSGFSEKFPYEYNLLQNMLSKVPNKRFTTLEIKTRYLALDWNANVILDNSSYSKSY